MIKKITTFSLPVLAGLITAYLGSIVVAKMSVVDMPASLVVWAQDNERYMQLVNAWEILVVQLLGAGLLAAVLTLIFTAKRFNSWLLIAVIVFVSEVVARHVILPTVDGLSINYDYVSQTAEVWNYSHEMVVLFCILVAAFLGRKSTGS